MVESQTILAPTELRCLYLDLDSFFAHVEQQRNPDLQGKPVGVVPTESDHTCLIAASYEAKRKGCKTGTLVREAKKLCPEIQLVQADHRHYVDYHHRIIDVVERCTHVTQICSIDEMACDLFMNDRSPEAAQDLAYQIKGRMAQELGHYLTCSIGVAPNRLLAKLVSEIRKPDGLVILEPKDLPGAIAHLDIKELCGIGPQMQARLRSQEIHSIGDLWGLSPEEMETIWGSINGRRYWYQLHGYQIPEIETQRSSIGHSHVLRPELRPRQQARLIARRLLLKAASRLRRTGYTTNCLHLSLKLEKGAKCYYKQRLEPTANNFRLLEVLELLWSQWGRQYPRRDCRVKKVGVTLTGLQEKETSQLNLFNQSLASDSPTKRQKQKELSLLMDEMNTRWGRDALTIGLLPPTRSRDTGTKIAFTRVPERAEFDE